MKKTTLLILMLLASTAFISGAIAAIIITSPQVTVTVEDYTLTLNANATTCVIGETINFSGTLTTDSFVIENQNITLHYSNDTWTGLNALTASDGSYSMLWTATQKGTFNFYAKAEIT